MSISIINLPRRLLCCSSFCSWRHGLLRWNFLNFINTPGLIWIKSITTARRPNGTGSCSLFSFFLVFKAPYKCRIETYRHAASLQSLNIQHWKAQLNSLVSNDSLLYSVSVSNKRITSRTGPGGFRWKQGQTIAVVVLMDRCVVELLISRFCFGWFWWKFLFASQPSQLQK